MKFHQGLVARALAAGKGGRRLTIHPDGGHMDDAPHPALLARAEQRNDAVIVNRGGGIAGSVLEYARTVQHRVDPDQMRHPVLRAGRACDIDDQCRQARQRTDRTAASRHANDVVPFGAQARNGRRSDKSARPDDQYAHVATFSAGTSQLPQGNSHRRTQFQPLPAGTFAS